MAHVDTRYDNTLSKIFSSAVFRDLATNDGTDRIKFIRQISHRAFTNKEISTVKDFFKKSYLHLRRNYPSEYVYKNEAIHQVVLTKHKLQDTGLFVEFPCYTSKADLLVVNGVTSVYEIKTELDNLTRLKQQLSDYSKAFSIVNVITCPSNYRQVSDLLVNTPFGLLLYDTRINQFECAKEAKEDINLLDPHRIFSIFRMNEYKFIINEEFGYIPNVLNTYIYSECFSLFQKLDREKQKNWLVKILHQRQIDSNQISFSNKLPTSLMTLGVSRPFTPKQCQNIVNSLSVSV